MYNVKKLLEHLRGFLATPEKTCSMNQAAMKLFLEDYETFFAIAKEWTKKFASKPDPDI